MDNKKILETMYLEKNTNAFSITSKTESKLYVRRYIDNKIYEEGKDFKVLNGNIIVFDDILDRSSIYQVCIESTDRVN